MSLRDDLLSPIPGANPGGVELRYDPVFDKIKEARREDLDAPQGEWATALKTADWPLVIKLSKDALATKSKDLQIASWLTEALGRREGFPGLRSGIEVLAGLVEVHWEHLYPEIDDGDAEMRAAPLEWVGTKLDVSVRRIPIDKSGHDFLQYKESRTVPTEDAANENSEKRTARDEAIANGRSTPEDLDSGFNATAKIWFKTLVADIEATIDAVKALDTVSREKFADVAPSFGRLVDTLEDCLRLANAQYKRKLEIEPDPVEAIESVDVITADGATTSGSGSAQGGTSGSLSPEPVSRDDATARILGAARYLRLNDPYNPSSYLLLRGFRWGELRASGATVDPKLLEAPATNVRTNLKGLLLDSKWPELLAASESVMGTPQGRGWIDLQRYALTACDELGSDYFPVTTAIRAALRALLTDLPGLLDMTLMDDTPTANVETRAWLRSTVIQESETSESTERGGGDPEDNGEARGRDPLSLATAEVRGGRPDRAIALLMREAGRAKTSRSRFLLQAELARIMVDAGHEAVAMPILDQLIADVEEHKLEDWEEGEVVAAPMALLYRVLEKTEGDAEQRQSLYLRICRLDPIQAISFAQP